MKKLFEIEFTNQWYKRNTIKKQVVMNSSLMQIPLRILFKLNCLIMLMSQLAISQNSVKVYFDHDQHLIQEESKDLLQHWNENYANTEILEIIGHCDSLGSNAYNFNLANRRIKSVLQILQQNKIPISKKIRKIALGKDFKQDPIQSENRNVTIVFQTIKPDFSIGKKISLKNLNFYSNSDVVLPESRYVLTNLLEIMHTNPTLVIDIQGHICCQPIDSEEISLKRAKAVYDFLLKNSISGNRISYKGMGSATPIHALPEQTEEERIENRRVEIEIIKI
jgi:outer membrane protein OmpA-like peptidoglycan-associated protein